MTQSIVENEPPKAAPGLESRGSRPEQGYITLADDSGQLLPAPAELLRRMPAPRRVQELVTQSRRIIGDIVTGNDSRFLVIVGPCSIHDYDATLEYARRLQELSTRLVPQIYPVMRCYFEKPRTTVGWKGLLNDPYLDGSHHLNDGIALTRRILLDVTALGVPVATEALDPNLSGYYQDLISWAAIGARTAESQLHRQFASGLPVPVGIKNGTDGNIETAIHAVIAARSGHCYAGINSEGRLAKIETRGNPGSHIILRGGNNGPNYDEQSIQACKAALVQAGADARVVIDCSHANSGKCAQQQVSVAKEVVQQAQAGERVIAGIMLESHLHEGRQQPANGLDGLRYGVSVTDECLGWRETEALLMAICR